MHGLSDATKVKKSKIRFYITDKNDYFHGRTFYCTTTRGSGFR